MLSEVELNDRLDQGIERALGWLQRNQQPNGHWAGFLKTNSAIEAEWILAMHFLGIDDDPFEFHVEFEPPEAGAHRATMYIAATGLGVVAVALLLGYSDTYLAAVGILVLHVVFTSYSNLAYGLFQAYQRLEYRALGQVLHACLMLAGAIVAARASWGVQGFAGVYAVSALVVLFYGLMFFGVFMSEMAS